ncbi:uncharacterized protein EI90DRAFT_3147343 [Cantharellus anzutake]|uniref:uncharacterized protein n=1 Tax=Cantharellus anzutake TaxID=1750568 RepID=UPI001906E5BE|nr:uncharacterized protein EI90DRAFT_3147343 [Cantharellus anzutake]KAF8317758.1 hypothetical protein EI90DRAFT_3147343 [Cantharellus anzutake]
MQGSRDNSGENQDVVDSKSPEISSLPSQPHSIPQVPTITKTQEFPITQSAGAHFESVSDETSTDHSLKVLPPIPLPDIRSPPLSIQNASDGPLSTSPPMLHKAFTAETPPTFDFQSFLDQMKTKSAEPIARYLRSFLTNFTKKPFSVNEQVKIIHDFQDFITAKMRECEIWKSMSSEDFDNACEAMEKLVMNRLYDYIFSPRVARAGRQVTNDDLERDHVLRQRIQLLGWLRPEHLEIPIVDGSHGFIAFAEQELVKINHYKAPRDKTICVLNASKIIFGLLRHMQREDGADSFLPLLIYVIVKANPDNLLSNIEYINRFRGPERLQGEIAYYLSSLMGAVSFIETLDHTSLSNISKEEFERNIEQVIQELSLTSESNISMMPSGRDDAFVGDESAQPLRIPSVLPNPAAIAEDTRRFFQRTGETISKPMNMLGKFIASTFDGVETSSSSWKEQTWPSPAADGGGGNATSTPQPQISTPYQPRIKSGASTPRRGTTPSQIMREGSSLLNPSASPPSRTSTPLDFTAMQREIDRAHAKAAEAARGTLLSIFPHVDPEVADWVLEATDGDLGLSIEKLLEM